MDKRSSRDMLSDLPLGIIHSILEFVPIREAVKTSILSRQWRYTWASLPHLVFDDEFVSSSDNDARLCHFITQALFLHKGPVHKFEFHESDMDCRGYIDQWLLFLSRNNIRVLILDFRPENHRVVHSCLYWCQNLTYLELIDCEITSPPPTFKGFPCLRCLVFENVEAHSDVIESLIANSPLLEKLTLNMFTCVGSSELRIYAPNLKYFGVAGDYQEICLYAPLLTIMSAALSDTYFTPENLQQKSSDCRYCKFLGGLSNLEELTAKESLIKYLSIGIESCHCTTVFYHLRVLDLIGIRFTDVKQIWVVVRLITGAPNLHKLQIIYDFQSKHASDLAISFWDSEDATNVSFKWLKVIEMWNARDLLNEIKLVKFLLASSPMLETLTFKPALHLTDKKLLKLTRELLSYSRASTKAQILFS